MHSLPNLNSIKVGFHWSVNLQNYSFAEHTTCLWENVILHCSNGYKNEHFSTLALTLPTDTSLFNPLNPELNPICYLLALLGAHHFLHVSRIRVKSLTFRRLMSYIYGAPILDVSRSHTTMQHSR